MTKIKSFILKARNAFDTGLSWLTAAMLLAILLLFLRLFLQMLLEVRPAMTLAFVIAMTHIAFRTRPTAWWAFIGIALYACGWRVAMLWGPIAGSAVCAVGVLLWLNAAFDAFIEGIDLPAWRRVLAL